ncbi:PREDICTED: malignant T-cell-amplified sequence 1 homolog [Rhagoletis zephyria]|uniref:malignant T-cell-amplified sequence 1 homolog n=1 Tax=Rhagoletis zephyria TaxID=28612 RepID=UPI0008115193|nr:PREDICTED: malignant T-cell-amplified sequence 1 homolog [Rhagoletis zephyria]KAH9390070.1 Malignant T-cell-amplified sequence 1 [Tyrophagus putrescentiae]
MFKKFEDSSVSGVMQLKSSVQKGIKNKLVESFPNLEAYIDEIIPKKDTLRVVKCHDHVEVIINSSSDYLFFRQRDGPYMPSLRLVHKYPFICPLMQVDKGAITFVLSGANIMCPGLTSKGAIMTPNLPANSVVTVVAEGKQNALSVGLLKMSVDEIAKVNRGIAIENVHFLNDGLWRLKPVK